MYAKYFEPIRCQPIKLLEIGLGCDMSYGPGASYYLWLDYFPNADIHFIEYDAVCAKAWEKLDPRVHVYTGDQANRTFLHEFIEKSGGQFDYIIDDGGHFMHQQITSLEVLFLLALKREGIYFLEDLLTSFIPFYGGGENVTYTAVNYIKDILSDMMTRKVDYALTHYVSKVPLSRNISRIECVDELCAFSWLNE